jgi:8-oxoguanine deaminase
MSKTLWIKSPLAIFTANESDASNGLVIKDDQIIELVASGQQPTTPVDEIIDASDKVILPGLINCHHHLYQTLTRAFPPSTEQKTLSLATNPVSGMGQIATRDVIQRDAAGVGRINAFRLHHCS